MSAAGRQRAPGGEASQLGDSELDASNSERDFIRLAKRHGVFVIGACARGVDRADRRSNLLT
jgi:hypothetical protein